MTIIDRTIANGVISLLSGVQPTEIASAVLVVTTHDGLVLVCTSEPHIMHIRQILTLGLEACDKGTGPAAELEKFNKYLSETTTGLETGI